MRFEHILQIYWTKGFFFGGQLFYFDQTLNELFSYTPGLGPGTKNVFKKRFELTYFFQNEFYEKLDFYQELKQKSILGPVNVLFSQINSVNNCLPDLHRLRIIRLYLIKTYRGRCHALGKPVRGQRTWSNAWNSFNRNKVLRNFIAETKRHLAKNKKEEKINYKMTKKKYGTKKKKQDVVKQKATIWF